MGIVLVVEDDEQNYMLLESLLAGMGHQTIHARNGRDGLALAGEYQPDLILLDLRLPLMNGWQVAEQLKGDVNLEHIPIVAVTVQVESRDEREALKAGCDAYISKPFTLKLMREYITRYLD
ncbi:MAG: response regulator [Anaerolineae bacterium]